MSIHAQKDEKNTFLRVKTYCDWKVYHRVWLPLDSSRHTNTNKINNEDDRDENVMVDNNNNHSR